MFVTFNVRLKVIQFRTETQTKCLLESAQRQHNVGNVTLSNF